MFHALFSSLNPFAQSAAFFGISLVTTLAWYSVLRFVFQKAHFLDHPEKYPHEGKRAPIPYGMGVLLYLNFASLALLFLDLDYVKLSIIVVLGLLVTLVNFIDDLDTIEVSPIHLPPLFRLLFQIGVGAFVGLTTIKIGYVSGVFGGIVDLTDFHFQIGSLTVFLIPLFVTVFWYVVVFNSVNWSDSIPWMTSGLSVVSLLVIAILSFRLYFADDSVLSQENSLFVLSLVSILLPSTIILWYFDVHRKVLIGDSGTMFLAFMIATLAIISGGKIATVATVLGVYLIDAFYVIFMRLYNGQNPLKGDHIHHLHFRLGKIGFSKASIRWLVYILSLLFGIAAIFLDRLGKIILFCILVVIVVFISRILSVKK